MKFLLLLVLCLAGCATPRTPNQQGAGTDAHWQGKLSVKVYSSPVQAFSAQFELQGSPQAGQLVLSSVLGSTLAQLEWRNGYAALRTSSEQRSFESLEELAKRATGADIPVADLFSWLQGQQTVSAHWTADLSELANGRIHAHSRGEPNPAELKIILDQ